VATLLRPCLRDMYPSLVLTDIREVPDLLAGESFVRCDLTDAAAIVEMLRGADAILHLGGYAKEGSLEELIPTNVLGTMNVLEGAKATGIRRVVVASTMHILGLYRRNERIRYEQRSTSRQQLCRDEDVCGAHCAGVRRTGGNAHHRPADRQL
jgi:uronate dehydrogenase